MGQHTGNGDHRARLLRNLVCARLEDRPQAANPRKASTIWSDFSWPADQKFLTASRGGSATADKWPEHSKVIEALVTRGYQCLCPCRSFSIDSCRGRAAELDFGRIQACSQGLCLRPSPHSKSACTFSTIYSTTASLSRPRDWISP